MSAERGVRRVVGTVVPIPGEDIDTDRIIPARYLKAITFDGLGDHAFHDERFDDEGRPTKGHPFDDPRFAGATVLVSGSNFGCGSSREHAPQALYRHGIRAVVAESFAEIFFGNSTTLGMPCVRADRRDLDGLVAAVEDDPSLEVTIDLEAGRLTAGSLSFPVHLQEGARQVLLEGRFDPLDGLLEAREDARAKARALGYLDGRA